MVIGGGGTSSPSNQLLFDRPACRVITAVGATDPATGKKTPVYVGEQAPWSAFRDREHSYGFATFDVDPRLRGRGDLDGRDLFRGPGALRPDRARGPVPAPQATRARLSAVKEHIHVGRRLGRTVGPVRQAARTAAGALGRTFDAMAKKQKDEHTALVEPAADIAAPPSTAATPVGSAVEIAPRRDAALASNSGSAGSGWLEPVGDTLVGSVQVLRGLLPESRLPLFLASTALVVTGLIDPPVALGAGLAFEALRRWEPSAAH
jgi:hypothetical protein